MSKDLEEQLNEMGPEYRSMVERMRAAYRSTGAGMVVDGLGEAARSTSSGHAIGWTIGYLVAASALIFAGLGVFFHGGPREKIYTAKATLPQSEFALAKIGSDSAIREIIRTQRADGSWKTDFLTRQNAAALAKCEVPEAKLAYRKAMRNLRSRGM